MVRTAPRGELAPGHPLSRGQSRCPARHGLSQRDCRGVRGELGNERCVCGQEAGVDPVQPGRCTEDLGGHRTHILGSLLGACSRAGAWHVCREGPAPAGGPPWESQGLTNPSLTQGPSLPFLQPQELPVPGQVVVLPAENAFLPVASPSYLLSASAYSPPFICLLW